MTVGNLGVCFGPTLLRPKEETMAAIMDIKFCNVVVEVLIANYDLVSNLFFLLGFLTKTKQFKAAEVFLFCFVTMITGQTVKELI